MAKARSKKEFAMHDDNGADPMADLLAHLEKNKAEPGIRDALALMDGSLTWDALTAPPEQADAGLSGQVGELVDGLSGARRGGQVYLVDVRQLEEYPDQPFKSYSPEKLEEMAEDIKRVGILSPILARKKGARLQILAGHNRCAAASLAGLREVPVLVLDADDDLASLIVTTTNLRQREKLLPSEKAFAYKMQVEALKRQGQRTGQEYDATSFITGQTGDSRGQVYRYIRLTELDKGLLELLDRGRISMTPAVAVSYLRPEDQKAVGELVTGFGASLTIERANRLKGLAEGADKPIGREAAAEVLLATDRGKSPDALRIPYDRLQPYLPEGVTGEREIEALVIAALKAYQRKK